jgi:hypothetical protein
MAPPARRPVTCERGALFRGEEAICFCFLAGVGGHRCFSGGKIIVISVNFRGNRGR